MLISRFLVSVIQILLIDISNISAVRFIKHYSKQLDDQENWINQELSGKVLAGQRNIMCISYLSRPNDELASRSPNLVC